MNRGPVGGAAAKDHVGKVLASWGDEAPEWVITLAERCNQSSQSAVATELAYSAATISQILSNSYRGDVGRVAEMVRGRYMAATVLCPIAGGSVATSALDGKKSPSPRHRRTGSKCTERAGRAARIPPSKRMEKTVMHKPLTARLTAVQLGLEDARHGGFLLIGEDLEAFIQEVKELRGLASQLENRNLQPIIDVVDVRPLIDRKAAVVLNAMRMPDSNVVLFPVVGRPVEHSRHDGGDAA